MNEDPLLSFRQLTITFPGSNGAGTEVVHGIDFDGQRGEVVALVGESGSGKTVTALAAVRLLPRGTAIGGSLLLDGSTCWPWTRRRCGRCAATGSR